MKIVPWILSETSDDFLLIVAQVEAMTDYVQIDVMDGHFVSTKGIPAEIIVGAETRLSRSAFDG